jgi:hypothetical protein
VNRTLAVPGGPGVPAGILEAAGFKVVREALPLDPGGPIQHPETQLEMFG